MGSVRETVVLLKSDHRRASLGNTIEPHCQGALPFTRLTVPKIHQQKMAEILGVKLQCPRYREV